MNGTVKAIRQIDAAADEMNEVKEELEKGMTIDLSFFEKEKTKDMEDISKRLKGYQEKLEQLKKDHEAAEKAIVDAIKHRNSVATNIMELTRLSSDLRVYQKSFG